MSNRIPFSPRQSLGQNFLHDPNMVEKIVGTLTADPEAHVVEIGAGTGALTTALAKRYEQLTALEVDERAVEVLRDAVPGVDVRQQDVRETDWAGLAEEKGGPMHVISNTPYHLSTEILFALLENRRHVAEGVLTMQREVVERICAEPKTKSYGILSVVTQLFADPRYAFTVSRHVFSPQPDVTSAVLHVRFGAEHEPEGLALDDVRPYVRAAFNQRRKMLRNSLSAWVKDQGVELPNDWGRKRAEALSPADFATLARHLNTHADPVDERLQD
jgi:16S rRNA (adenine1518-N6/adenine1519-N6)-dimethyltransferase